MYFSTDFQRLKCKNEYQGTRYTKITRQIVLLFLLESNVWSYDEPDNSTTSEVPNIYFKNS